MKRSLALARISLALVAALATPACDLGTIDLTGIDVKFSSLRVSLQNSTPSDVRYSFGGATHTLTQGQKATVTSYFSTVALPSSEVLDVEHASTVSRVTFQPLRLPEKGETKDATVLITLSLDGTLAASTYDPDWVRIVSVSPR